MSWHMARTLELLLAEVNARWPNRDKTSDGGIGDPAHGSRTSDHNPDADGVGCARDIDEDGIDGPWLAEHFRTMGMNGDPRIKYVIYEGRICSRTDGWKWRPYTGANSHSHHLHLSVTQAGRNSVARWGVYPIDKTPPEEQMNAAQEKKVDELRVRVDHANSEIRTLKQKLDELLAVLKKTHPGA